MEMLQFLSHFNYHDNQSTITITGETMTSNNGHFFLSFDFSVGNFIKPFAMKWEKEFLKITRFRSFKVKLHYAIFSPF